MEKYAAIKKISERFRISEPEILRLLAEMPVKKKPRAINKINPIAKIVKNPSPVHYNKYLFTIEDYKLLLTKVEECLKQIEYYGKEAGESCAESDSWHDNFSYEEGLRQQNIWKTRHRNLRKIKENAEIIQNKPEEKINIGSTVEMEINGNILIKRIGSYMTFSDDDLSYASPLAQAIIGKGLNEEISFMLNGRPTLIKIKKY